MYDTICNAQSDSCQLNEVVSRDFCAEALRTIIIATTQTHRDIQLIPLCVLTSHELRMYI